MEHNNANETAEQSSDEEELFSYLKKVHEVKQAEQEVKQAEDEVEEAEHEAEKAEHETEQTEQVAITEKSCANEHDDIWHVNQINHDTTAVMLHNTTETVDDDLQNPDANKRETEQLIAIHNNENKPHNNTKESNAAYSESDFEEHIEISNCTESKAFMNNPENITGRSNMELVEEKTTDFIAESKNTSPLKEKDTDTTENPVCKQNPESSRESDKYYLINEKDWLSLCAKLSTKDKQINFKEQHEANKEADNGDKHNINKTSLIETSPQSVKDKSMFSAFKQYNPVSKDTLRKGGLSEKTSKDSGQKVNVTSETTELNINSKGQTKPVFGNELNKTNSESKLSVDPKTPASPNVEIVYIRLEDGQIKYDVSKSPLATPLNVGETNLQAVKKLDFLEQGLAFENRLQGYASNASNFMQNSSQENDNRRYLNSTNKFSSANVNNHESSNPNAAVNNTLNTCYDTAFKSGMQVRFVRINNKLTRVYENVESNVIDQVLDASFAEDHDESAQNLHSPKHRDDGGDDSFNFDDSQLVAFPLNAIDPEMIIKDDSLVQLTPSKLEILNTSSKLDPLTPSKLDFLTPSKIDPLTPSKMEMLTPNKLNMLTPSKLDILSTGKLDMFDDNSTIKKFDDCLSSPSPDTSKPSQISDVRNEKSATESPIVLKVTKSGELVQCKSNESSPERKASTKQTSLASNDKSVHNQKSHIQNLWKTFKPVQKKRKMNGKQISSVRERKDADNEPIKNYDSTSEGSSDEDDLTSYFSMTNHASKDSVIACPSVDMSKGKSDIPSNSVSIQASFSDSSDDSNENDKTLKLLSEHVKKRQFSGAEGKWKNTNYKTVKMNDITDVELETETTAEVKLVRNKKQTVLKPAKTTNVNTKVKLEAKAASKMKVARKANEAAHKSNISSIGKTTSLSDSDRKHCSSGGYDSDSLNHCKDQTCKKRKGNTQIQHFYKDCNYKQVDFKDFESEEVQISEAPSMDKGKEKVDLSIKRKAVVENHTDLEKLKIEDSVPPSAEVKEVKGRKRTMHVDKEVKQRKVTRKVHSDKETEQRKDTIKVQVKNKGKKPCVKKDVEEKGSRVIEKSMETNETDMKSDCKTDIKTKTLSDNSQKKIEFLEKLFQIKLKEAASTVTDKKNCTLESSAVKSLHEENSKSVRGRTLKNKKKSSVPITLLSKEVKFTESAVGGEIVRNGKKVNIANKKYPAVKKSKRIKNETLDNVASNENEDHVVSTRLSDIAVKGCKRRCKKSEKVEKDGNRQEQNICKIKDNPENNTDIRQGSSTTKGRNKSPEVKKKKCRQRKQNASSVHQIKGGKTNAQTVQTICKNGCDKTEQIDVGSKSKSQKKIAKGMPQKFLDTDDHKSEQLKRIRDKSSHFEDAGEMEFTKMKKPRKKAVGAKPLSNSVDVQQEFMENIEKEPDSIAQINKNNPKSERITKNSVNKKPSGKAKTRKRKSRKSSLNIESEGESVSFPNTELQSSKMKRNIHLGVENIEGQLDNAETDIVLSQRSVLLNNNESVTSDYEDLNCQASSVSILATFQPLQEEDSSQIPPGNKTKKLKRQKKESDNQAVSKSKKMKIKADIGDTFWKDTKNESKLTCEGDESMLKDKPFKHKNKSLLDVDKSDMPLDLSFPLEEAKEIKESSTSKDSHKISKNISPKKLRDGKTCKESSSKKASSHKTLKSTKKPYSGKKVKNATKRQEKESWKSMLDDGAFKLDFDKNVNEEHKPVNVRHMIRNILKSVKGAEKISDRHVKQRERKDRIHKHGKSSDRNIKQRLTSESDDAWLSDSGPSASFPAFKFTGTSDSEENRESTKLQVNDEPQGSSDSRGNNNSECELEESERDRLTKMSDSQLFKQANTKDEKNYIELHHSPLKVSNLQRTSNSSTEKSVNLISVQTKELVQSSKESPEMKKNVDKLRALLDKVSDKKVVKNLQFAETVNLSDTEH